MMDDTERDALIAWARGAYPEGDIAQLLTDEFDRLRAEVGALRTLSAREFAGNCETLEQMERLRAENKRLRAENEANREDAELFRRWIEEASVRPSRLANAICGCTTPDEYRTALRNVLLIPYSGPQAIASTAEKPQQEPKR